MTVRGLALQGGGIRGALFQAYILVRLKAYRPALLEETDAIAGTSGGSIVAGALAAGYSPEEIVDILLKEGPRIFREANGFVSRLLSEAKYDNRRKKIFERYYGDMKIYQAPKRMVITGFDVKHHSGRWQPVAFHNFEGSKYGNMQISDAVFASSAAPTYFPVARVSNSKFIDGGVWGNNPSMSLYSELVNPYHGGCRADKVHILNIGAISTNMTLRTARQNLGVIDWFRNGFIDLILDGAAMDSITYYARNVMGPRYHLVDWSCPKAIPMDDPSKAALIKKLAYMVDLEPTVSWLEGFWYK